MRNMKAGVVGLGNMGSGIADNLIRAKVPTNGTADAAGASTLKYRFENHSNDDGIPKVILVSSASPQKKFLTARRDLPSLTAVIFPYLADVGA